MLTYKTLANVGLAETFNVTDQEKELILNRTLDNMARRNMFGDMMRITQQGVNAPEVETGAFRLARYKALKQAFSEMVADEIQITDYIKLEPEK